MRGKRLTAGKVKQIRELKSQGYPYRQIAKKLGVSLSAIAENTKEVKAPERATRKYPEATAEEEPVQHPRVIRPEHQRPLHLEDFEGFKTRAAREKPKTAEELREHYKQMDHYKEEGIRQLREFYRLLDEGSFAEAENALQKEQEAWRKLNELSY